MNLSEVIKMVASGTKLDTPRVLMATLVTDDTPLPQKSERIGWTCPVCGRAYSPDVMFCPRCSDAADQERVADPSEDVRLVEKEEL